MGSVVRGVVTHEMREDRFLVETDLGYSLLEWFGGTALVEAGDTVEGDLHSFGFKDLVINPGQRRVRVWVDNFWMDRADALAFYRGE